MAPLSRLAREELAHFEEVLRMLEARGQVFQRMKPAPYAGRLMTLVRAQEPDRLLDTLMVCAIIEARSCERMQILTEHLEDEALRRLYKGLLASEARHHRTYVDLALGLFEEDRVRTRLREVAQHEAEILRDAPKVPRLHNG